MNKIKPDSASPLAKGTKASLGAFALSAIIHASVFLLVGSYVVFEGVVPQTPFLAVQGPADLLGEEEVLPEPEDFQDPVSMPTVADEFSTEAATAGEATSADILVSTGINSTFSLPPAVGAPSVNPKIGFGTGGVGEGKGAGAAGPRGNIVRTLFGSSESVPAAMKGTLYDLKQKKGGGSADQAEFIRAFAAAGFKRSMLRDFYEAKVQLFATQIFMPCIKADEAPKAFQAEKEIQPLNWLVFYEGKFASPDSGNYRFVGQGDDVLIVRVNGKVVFDGSLITAGQGNEPLAGLKPKPEQIRDEQRITSWFPLVYGEWMALTAGVNNTIEVLVGEIPGGEFYAYLMIQKEGKKYDLDPARGNAPILPIFRTLESSDDWSEHPPPTHSQV